MSRTRLLAALEALPRGLADQLDTYMRFIEEVAPSIFDDTAVPFDLVLRDQLVFLAGVRRLWALVNSQYRMLDESLDMLRATDIDAVRVGSSLFGRNTGDYVALRELRMSLRNELRRLDILPFIDAPTVSDILLRLAEA